MVKITPLPEAKGALVINVGGRKVSLDCSQPTPLLLSDADYIQAKPSITPWVDVKVSVDVDAVEAASGEDTTVLSEVDKGATKPAKAAPAKTAAAAPKKRRSLLGRRK